MIESVDNLIQLLFSGICTGIGIFRAVRYRSRFWALLSLFSSNFFLGTLYWQLFILFYGDYPRFSLISDFNWYVSYMFLILLLFKMGEGQKPLRSKGLWLIPVFTFGMCAFYMQFGAYISNLICALLLTLILREAIGGLIQIKTKPEREKYQSLYLTVLFFCAAEYGLWTSSCFFEGDSFSNPYYWFDVMLSFCFLLFLPAVRKAVGG